MDQLIEKIYLLHKHHFDTNNFYCTFCKNYGVDIFEEEQYNLSNDYINDYMIKLDKINVMDEFEKELQLRQYNIPLVNNKPPLSSVDIDKNTNINELLDQEIQHRKTGISGILFGKTEKIIPNQLNIYDDLICVITMYLDKKSLINFCLSNGHINKLIMKHSNFTRQIMIKNFYMYGKQKDYNNFIVNLYDEYEIYLKIHPIYDTTPRGYIDKLLNTHIKKACSIDILFNNLCPCIIKDISSFDKSSYQGYTKQPLFTIIE